MTGIKVVSPTEMTMTMSKAYSPTWVLYNDLSQVVPMPAAWDQTASGPSNCDTTVSDCAAVYSYLNKQAEDVTGYATSPIWGIVDGPWRLSAFNADGHITFVPNKSYSGPVKPKLAAFQEVPFTTDSAEYDVLRSPSSSTKIDFGYLPDQDAPAKPANAAVGSNPLSGYTLAPLYPWGIDYYAVNYQSTTGDHGADLQAAVLPAGAGVPDEPGRDHLRPAARVRRAHGRPGRPPPRRPSGCRPQGKGGRPVPVQPGQGQEPAGQPRLERGPERDQHLRQARPSAARGSPRAAR